MIKWWLFISVLIIVPQWAQANAVSSNDDEVFALAIALPLAWSQNLGVAAGTGTMHFLALVHERHHDQQLWQRIQLCQHTTPDYQSVDRLGGEHYGMEFSGAGLSHAGFSDALYHRDSSLAGLRASGLLALQIGIQLEQPLSKQWPKRTALLKGIIDSDGDSYPGFTITSKVGSSYQTPPTNLARNQRAKAFFVASRTVVQLSPQTNNSHYAEGWASIAKINGKLAINAHILGCLHVDNSLCTPYETAVVDGFAPQFRLQQQGQFRWRQLSGRQPNCSDAAAIAF